MRGRIALLFTAALLALAIVVVAQLRLQETAVAGSEVILQGDADCNQVVDYQDAAAVLFQTAGGASVGCAARANVDCTGGVGVLDALLIVKYGAGLGAGGAGGCVAIGGELPEVDGGGLIDAALERGDITVDEAVLLKAQWAFGDPQLPSQYNVPSLGGSVPDEIFEPPAGVSAQTLAALEKYRLPPSNPDSWYYASGAQGAGAALPAGQRPPPNPNWTSVASTSGKIKVWYDSTIAADQAKAQAVAGDADNVFQKHKDIMDIEPLADGSIDANINGGGPQYDIYMTSIANDDYGYVAPFNPPAEGANPCPATVTFMVLNKDKSDNDIKGTLSHELFHAFQRARPLATTCADRRFVFESTATWAEDYVYPDLQTERIFSKFKQSAGKAFLTEDNRYHAWPFWLYIARSDSPDTIGEIFKKLETMAPVAAIDEAILGGFESRWKEFTLYGWNMPPVDHLKQWDGLDWRPQYRELGSSLGPPSELRLADDQAVAEYSAENSPLQAMSFEYYQLTIPPPADGFKDPPMLTINNPFGSGAPTGLAVQIAYRVGSTWETDDLTDMGSKTWCRTDPADKVEEVIVMVSNSNLPPAANSAAFSRPLAVLRDACGFTGEAHGTYIFNTSGTEWRAEVDATQLVFVAFPGSLTTFKTVSGTVTQTYSGVVYNDTDETPGPCILSGSTTVPVLEDDGFLTITAQDANSVTYNLSGFTPETNVNATISCPGDPPSNISLSSQFWVQVSGRISNSKNVLEGTAPGASEGSEYNWRLERSQN